MEKVLTSLRRRGLKVEQSAAWITIELKEKRKRK